MAATGTEYVTLEQLKDLVTNIIQPLKDTVDRHDDEVFTLGTDVNTLKDKTSGIRKIVPVTCADYDQTFVQLKLASGYSGGVVPMGTGDMMVIVNSEDGTYENGSYLLYTGLGMELTNSYVTWQKAQLIEYKTSASTGGTAELPEGTAILKQLDEEEGIKQLYVVEGGEQKPVGVVAISDMDMNVSTQLELTVSSGVVIGATTKGPAPRATIYAQTQYGTDNVSFVSLDIASNDTSGYKQGTIVAFDTTTKPLGEQLTADDIAKARKVNTIAADHASQIVML